MHAPIQARNLSFSWPGRPPLFSGLSFTVPPGVTWLTGDEQTGKTTLLRLLAGELTPQAGAVQVTSPVFWVDPRNDGGDALTPPQCFERMAQRHPAMDRMLLDELVDALDLAPHLAKRLDMLSTGSRRKVWLAAALASGAALTLLDQPFAAVDRASMRVITAALGVAAAAGRAFVVADYEPPPDAALAATINLDA
ncbi:MAG: ATP-binding cassette domain-containing protein [Ramlibacter sp.]